jgi:hypothetical protein
VNFENDNIVVLCILGRPTHEPCDAWLSQR